MGLILRVEVILCAAEHMTGCFLSNRRLEAKQEPHDGSVSID